VPHELPQVPQFVLSVWVLRQRPLQRVCPRGQAQAPLWQVVPGPQTVLQAPQLLLSLEVFAQRRVPAASVQLVWGGVQEQVPMPQNCPTPHALLQKPQLVPSVSGFTQTLLQRIWPTGHGLGWQEPITHWLPAEQVTLQAPQLRGSLNWSTQTPLQRS